MLQVSNVLLVTVYLAPDLLLLVIRSLGDISFEFIDIMNSLSGKGGSVGSDYPLSVTDKQNSPVYLHPKTALLTRTFRR